MRSNRAKCLPHAFNHLALFPPCCVVDHARANAQEHTSSSSDIRKPTNFSYLSCTHHAIGHVCFQPHPTSKTVHAPMRSQHGKTVSSVEPSQAWVSNPSYVQTTQCAIKMPRAKNIARLGQRLIVAQGCYIPFVASPAALAT